MNEEEIIKNIEDMLLHAETNLLDYEALAIQGLLDLYNKEKILAENHKTAFEKQTENLHEIENLYKKEKEENKKLRNCHLRYEEMTGIDLLLED